MAESGASPVSYLLASCLLASYLSGVARSAPIDGRCGCAGLGGTDPGVPTGAPARSCRRRSVPVQPVRLFGDPVLRTP
ncbi:MAG: hypothetical protein ACXWYP_09875, partial [Pseudonocardia sp.]